jgi:hypothetical protein
VGSDRQFVDLASTSLNGVMGEWRLFAASAA